jgi:hypothetical protein
MLVTAPTAAGAVEKFMTVVRTAIHANGGATPGWDGDSGLAVGYEPKNLRLEYI